MNPIFSSVTKSDVVHAVLGTMAAVIWLFGAKLGIPSDAVVYAKEIVAMLGGSAFGVAVATPTVPNVSAPISAGATSQPTSSNS